jgi:hypothetical protein
LKALDQGCREALEFGEPSEYERYPKARAIRGNGTARQAMTMRMMTMLTLETNGAKNATSMASAWPTRRDPNPIFASGPRREMVASSSDYYPQSCLSSN